MKPEVNEISAEVRDWLVRADVYRLLAAALEYPLPETRAALAALIEQVPSGENLPDAVGLRLGELGEALRTEDISRWQWEYTRLFDTGPICAPYETRYRPGGKESILGDISGFYRAFGLKPSGSRSDMPDHISAELQFMSILCLKRALAERAGLSEQSEIVEKAHLSFFKDHLAHWAKRFAEDVMNRTEIEILRDTAHLLSGWMGVEAGRLGVEIGPAAPMSTGDGLEEELVCPASL